MALYLVNSPNLSKKVTPDLMVAKENILRLSRVIFAAACVALTVGSGPAKADSSVTDIDLHYKLFVGGARVAKLDLSAQLGQGKYSVNGAGGTIGFVDNFADMTFSGSSKGLIEKDAVTPRNHEHQLSQKGERKRHVVLKFDKEGVPNITATPAFSYGSKRAPITTALTVGTIDPVTSFVVPVKEGVSPLHPSQCKRIASIFDGHQRYDFSFKHKASYGAYRLKSAGFTGPALRCVVRFIPVAGHYKAGFFPFLARRKDIDIVLTPSGEGRYLVPLRIRFPTPIGQAVFQAMRFNSKTTTKSAALSGN